MIIGDRHRHGYIYNFHTRPSFCLLWKKALKGANSSADIIWFLFRLIVLEMAPRYIGTLEKPVPEDECDI
jgi:hypothetical protein